MEGNHPCEPPSLEELRFRLRLTLRWTLNIVCIYRKHVFLTGFQGADRYKRETRQANWESQKTGKGIWDTLVFHVFLQRWNNFVLICKCGFINYFCIHSQHGDSSSDEETGRDGNEAKRNTNGEIKEKENEADKLTERLENAEREQKELFLILFQVWFFLLGFEMHRWLIPMLD